MNFKKLTPELVSGIKDAGFDIEPKEIQNLCIPKIKSGADLYIIAPEGSGKTTAIVMGVIQQLKSAFEEAPRAIIMTASKEKTFEMEEQFKSLGKHTNLRTFVVFDQGKIQYQKDMIYEGIDILIGTQNRLIELIKIMGIPMTKVKVFVIDDAETIPLDKYPKYVYRIAENIGKSQLLIVANKWTDKFNSLNEKIMKNPIVLNVEKP
jgi:ATP-dependent RNA helicase RhlE